MNKEIIEINRWDPANQKEYTVIVELEAVIRNPGGYRMDEIGIILINKERQARGLSKYQYNASTRTFDEVKPPQSDTVAQDAIIDAD